MEKIKLFKAPPELEAPLFQKREGGLFTFH